MSQIDWTKTRLNKTHEAISKFSASTRPSETKILMCSHMEAKFIAFSQLLKDAGFEVHAVSNLPTSLKKYFIEEILNSGIIFYDTSNLTFEESEALISELVNKEKFDFIFDDGGHTYSKIKKQSLTSICTEYTQSGINLAKKMDLKIPVINLNSSLTKSLIGNVHGTGLSTLTAIQAITNISFYKLNVGIIGFGPVGLSCALSFLGAMSDVSVYDIDTSKKSLAEKYLINFVSKQELLARSDLIITCTGAINAISSPDLPLLKNHCILANVGHYNHEIKVPTETYIGKITPNITEHQSGDKNFYVLCDGNLVNLAFGLGYPIQIIDASFAAAIYAWEYFSKRKDLEGILYEYPAELDSRHFKDEIAFYSMK